MASSAHLVTIKRSGDDGAHFPLTLSSCLFGRSIECDIRIQLPVVSKKHCKIEINDQQAILHNFSSTNPTQVNGATVDEPVQLKHGDIITIIDRSFRYENGNHEDGSRSTGFPGKSFGQEPVQQASRASFSDPDGKGQDASTSKTTSRRSLVHAKRLSGDSSASGGSKDSITKDPSNTCSSGHVEQHSGRNTEEPTSDVLFKKSRAAGSSSRELKSSPAQSLSNSKKHESPFEKLYQSMKEELNIKSQKQSRRKSEPQPECAAGKETWETKLLVSCKSRAKSSGSIPGPAVSSPKVGKIWTEDQSSAVGPLQTSTEALSSSFSLAETAEMKTPVRNSQQLKNEESHVSGIRESVNLNESEGAKADYKIVTPRKLATRNQTPVKVEGAASPAGKPENISCKKRKSLPAKIEVLSTETQSQFSSAHHLASDEKKTPKDSFSKPEKLATAARQIYSGLPGLSSVDISNFGDSVNKSEGMSLKRRRVSFGGHLRPELFDENLPPNTPLKRGETPTKRKSLAPHTPSVLKKIIKERPQSPGKQESPGITLPSPNDQRRRSGRSAPASSGSESLPQTDTPKKASRKSGNLPAKRASISRSQHDILQMISSKRRSGASEANLIVAKSWADVVKLGTKQTQTKVVKHVPQKQASKRQRRPNTPKKPTSSLHNQFSTGHANSPCTIVIGRAQIEKVSMPARPYKMLNNLMLNQKIDFSEDLSGLTEMFKTPVKEKQQQMNDMGSILSNSENLPEKQFQVTNSGDKPLPFTSEILGENALSSTQNAAKEPSDKYSASPTLRRRSIKNGNTVQTPENVQNITHLEKKTPGSVTEPLKTVSSVRKLRRSRELRHTLGESMNESTEADLDQGIIVRYLRKTSLQGQEVDQRVQDSEKCSQRFKESVELKEDPEKTSAMRSSARKQKPAKDLIGSQMVTQTAACPEELFNQEKGTTEKPEESMHKQSTPISDGQRAAKQKGDKVLCKTPQPTTDNTKTSTKPWHSTSGKKVDMKEEHSEQKKFVHMSGGTRHTPKVPELVHGGIKALKESENRMLDLTVTGSKKPVGKAKEKAQPMQDLTGFHELFLSPVPGDKITKMFNKSPYPEFPELARTPASIKRLSKTGLGKGDVREELSTLGKRTKSPGRTSHTPIASELEENDTTAFVETPKQKLDFTENSTGSKRRSRTPKMRAQPLEDLDGFQELFQTPAGASDPVTVGETTKVSLESLQPAHIRTPASTKRLSKAGLDKADEKEELSTLGKRSKSPGRASRTPTSAGQQEKGIKEIMETSSKKLELLGNLTGSKKQSRTPKKEGQSLEDLPDCQELFQTPDPLVVGITKRMSFNSPQPDPVITLRSIKRQSRASMGKMEVKEEFSESEKCQQIEKAIDTLQVSNDSNVIRAPKQSAKRKLDSAASLPSSKRLRRVSKDKTPCLEDLSGFQQLFQTPGHSKDSLAIGETLKMPTKSPQSGPLRNHTSRKSLPKISLSKTDVTEELSALQKQSPGKAPTASVQMGEGIQAIRKTSKEKLETAVSVIEFTRQRRAPKVKALPLEDLDGIQELFQTPDHSIDPVIGNKRTSMSLRSPQPGIVRTLQTSKRLAKTSLGKEHMREEISSVNILGCAVGENEHTSRLQEDDGRENKDLEESRILTLGPSVNVTGSKKQRGTHKKRSESPEDIFDLQELFQTPASHKDSVTLHETTKMSLESSEHFRTPASTKRLSKAGLGNADEREKLSALGKRTKSLGRASHIAIAPVLKENDTRALVETRKQKLDFTENSAGSKRRSRTPKMRAQPLEDLDGFMRAQPLEDLDGFQELFQTPAGASDPVTVGKTTKVSLESLQAEPVRTPASTKRLSKAGLGKVDVREQLSPLNKRTCSAQEDMHVLRLSENDVTGTKDLKESAAQILNPAVSVTSSKRQQGACKKKSQFPEDLSGLQELFQTPGHDKDSLAGDELTKMPHRSLPPEPINTSVTSQRQSRTRRMKVHVKSEPSGDRMLPQMSEEIMDISRVPECEGKGIRTRKQSVKRKLDTAVSVPSSKRQRVARAEKAQTLEDLPEFQELYQTPSLAVEPVIVDKTTKVPSKSPEPVDITSETQTGRRLRRVGVMKEPLAQRKTTRVLRETRNTYKEPVGDNKDVKEFKESSMQKQDPAVILTGRRRQPRTLKEKTQPLKELPSIQEETATRISCEFPQPEEKESSASSKRQLRIQLCKVGVKEEPTAQRKPRGRVTRNTLKEPMSDSGNAEELKESTKRKIDPVASVPVSKRPRRVPREKTQPLEVSGPIEPVQIPGHTEELASDERPTRVPCDSLQPEQADNLQTSPRRLRTRCGKIEVDQEPSVVKKTVPTSRQTTRSRKVPVIDDKDTQASKESGEQQLETVANVTGNRRQLRAHKNEVQPCEVLGNSKKLIQISEHTEKLRHDTSTLKSTIQQMPDPIKPLRTSRRVLRASKEDTVETVEMLVDTRDPAESQSKSNTFLSPKRKPARGGGGPRTRGLCSVTPNQEAIDEKPAPKKQRAAPSKRHVSPEPVEMKHLRIMSSKTEPVEEQISNVMKTEEEAQVENSTPPDQKMPLPSRYRKKNSEKHPRPKVGASTEKDGMKTNEKTMKSSQETELQSTDDGAKKSPSRGKGSGKRTCLRSGGQSEIPQPRAAEQKTSETAAKILKTQKE
ncbi:proliferation marker protein Ki-67, partial [Microtus ochrogaster]|uniref:Proliferation marker protein Ki-67 n=1 Tax=Microtus ochrogaster TaxID=79684 RepID=A0ABM1AJT6_MICOH